MARWMRSAGPDGRSRGVIGTYATPATGSSLGQQLRGFCACLAPCTGLTRGSAANDLIEVRFASLVKVSVRPRAVITQLARNRTFNGAIDPKPTSRDTRISRSDPILCPPICFESLRSSPADMVDQMISPIQFAAFARRRLNQRVPSSQRTAASAGHCGCCAGMQMPLRSRARNRAVCTRAPAT